MIDIENKKISQKTIVVPEYIEYPDIRIHIPAKDITEVNDCVLVNITVYGSKGIKSDYSQKIVFKEVPIDKDIIGVVTASFTETNKNEQ